MLFFCSEKNLSAGAYGDVFLQFAVKCGGKKDAFSKKQRKTLSKKRFGDRCFRPFDTVSVGGSIR